MERLAVSISFKCIETVAFLFRLLLFGETHCSGFGFLSSVVFVETAYISGFLGFSSSDYSYPYFKRVQNIHKAQESLIKYNNDIILGSSFIYDRYIPDQSNYESTKFKTKIYLNSKGKKLPYDKALARARYVVCYPTKNSIHLTSSALCQVGNEVAINFAKSF